MKPKLSAFETFDWGVVKIKIMHRIVLVFLFCLWLRFINAETEKSPRVRYDNYHVYQLQPSNEDEINLLQSLDGKRESYLFLDPPQRTNKKVHVLVAPKLVPNFEETLKSAKIHFKLLESDAQSQIESNEVADPNRRDGAYSWRQYHELNDTYDWLRSLAEKYPKVVSLFVAGKSYEGREILGIKIAYGNKEKKVIFLEGGMHAREWISPATTTFIANQLLTSNQTNVRLFAENFDWYIVPHCNPDGYVYSHTTDRLWRKTRKPYTANCYGADPNRNWDFHWNEVGATNNPCSDTYAGPEAFSEIEVRTLAEFIERLKGKLSIYISFHSYSQLLLFPYGYTAELPPNYADLKRVFNAAVVGARRRYGTWYTGGNLYDAIYPASGSSVDWAYAQAGVPYSYCYELRPSSYAFWIGFKLPASQIIPTGKETLDSLIAMIKEAAI